jgi:lysophospholipase L1-like esterase
MKTNAHLILFSILALSSLVTSCIATETKFQDNAPSSLPAQADSKTYLAEICEAMNVQWPKNHIVNIVCHGHSVPSGYFKTPVVDTFDSYPYLLHHVLKERHPFAIINVILTSKGGEESESGAKRFARDVLSMHPDVVTIDYSLNDRRIGLARAEAAWRSMISAAKQQGVKVLLLTPTPDERAKLDDPNDPLVQHTEQVRRLARENGVGLVDSFAAFQIAIRSGKNLHDLMAIPNHPNRLGHDLVVKELLPWFENPAASPGQSQAGASQGTLH